MPGIALKFKKKQLISDAVFTRNGYVHLIEIDNTRHMQDNLKKIKSYIEMRPDIHQKFNMQTKLYFFTATESRKRKFTNAFLLNGDAMITRWAIELKARTSVGDLLQVVEVYAEGENNEVVKIENRQ